MTQFLKNTDPRFHLVELRSKTFAFLILAILLGIVGFAAFKQEWFRPVKHYWMVAETSEGLQQGMSVRLSGFRIGRVQKIELVANREVRVDFEIFEEYTGYIRQETRAKLRGENLIGDRFIELGIDSDKDDSALLPEGSEIAYQRGKTIDEMVESLENQFTPILTGLGSLSGARVLPVETAGASSAGNSTLAFFKTFSTSVIVGNFFSGEVVKYSLGGGEVVARNNIGEQKSLSGVVQYPGR